MANGFTSPNRLATRLCAKELQQRHRALELPGVRGWFHDITVHCPAGKVAMAGGIETLNQNESPKVTLHGTHPAAIENAPPWHAHAWEAEFTIHEAGPTVQALVVCAVVADE